MHTIDAKNILENGFYFARHGETDYNTVGIVTGCRDIALNSKGVEQAIHAAEVTRNIGISTCISSPLSRALVTARLMLSLSEVVPHTVNGLEERHWGGLEGMSKYTLDDYNFAEYGVEPWADFMTRTEKALTMQKYTVPLLIVAHSGTFRVLCDYLQISIAKKPVRNAWPYHFYRSNASWHVEEVS